MNNSHIFSDCKAAITAIASLRSHITLQPLIDTIQKQIHHVQQINDCKIHLYWVPGHADLTPNELADKLAKEAVELSQQFCPRPPEFKSLSVIKAGIRKHIIKKRQRGWNRSEVNSGAECYVTSVQ